MLIILKGINQTNNSLGFLVISVFLECAQTWSVSLRNNLDNVKESGEEAVGDTRLGTAHSQNHSSWTSRRKIHSVSKTHFLIFPSF